MRTHVEIGTELARVIFQTRGNHTEVHLQEVQLAAMLAMAAEAGMKELATTLTGRQ